MMIFWWRNFTRYGCGKLRIANWSIDMWKGYVVLYCIWRQSNGSVVLYCCTFWKVLICTCQLSCSQTLSCPPRQLGDWWWPSKHDEANYGIFKHASHHEERMKGCSCAAKEHSSFRKHHPWCIHSCYRLELHIMDSSEQTHIPKYSANRLTST